MDNLIPKSDCPHKSTVLETTGGMHFDGEPWDDFKDRVICTDCGEDVTELVEETQAQLAEDLDEHTTERIGGLW